MDAMTSPLQAALLDREQVIQRGLSAEVERLQRQQEERWAECLRLLGEELGAELPPSTQILPTEDGLYRLVWGEEPQQQQHSPPPPPPEPEEEEEQRLAAHAILAAEGLSERTLDPEPATA